MFKLPDIAWVIVQSQRLQRLLAEPNRFFCWCRLIAVENVFSQAWNIASANAVRWHFDSDDVQAMVEIYSEPTLGHKLAESLIRRRPRWKPTRLGACPPKQLQVFSCRTRSNLPCRLSGSSPIS